LGTVDILYIVRVPNLSAILKGIVFFLEVFVSIGGAAELVFMKGARFTPWDLCARRHHDVVQAFWRITGVTVGTRFGTGNLACMRIRVSAGVRLHVV